MVSSGDWLTVSFLAYAVHSVCRTVAMDITYTQSYICTCVWYSGVNYGCTYVLTRFGCFLWSRNRDTVVPGDILVIRNQKMLT